MVLKHGGRVVFGCALSVSAEHFFLIVIVIVGLTVIVISKPLKRYSKAKRTRAPAATNQRGLSKGRVKRSSGPISRIPGGIPGGMILLHTLITLTRDMYTCACVLSLCMCVCLCVCVCVCLSACVSVYV